MLFQQVLHAMDAETCALGAGKQHVTATALRLTQPAFQHGERGSGDGCAAFLAPLADYAVRLSPCEQAGATRQHHCGLCVPYWGLGAEVPEGSSASAGASWLFCFVTLK